MRFFVRVAMASAVALNLCNFQGETASASPLPAGDDPQAEIRGVVYETTDAGQTRAEEVFATAEAAIYLPAQRRVRWLESGQAVVAVGTQSAAGVRTVREFEDDLERDFPRFRSGAQGPYLLKRPVTSDLVNLAARSGSAPATPLATTFTDSFESGMSNWSLFDNTFNLYSWGATTCQPRTGAYSADALRGGLNALTCTDAYAPNVTTTMMHKNCEAIQGASQAWLDAYILLATEPGADTLGFYYAGADERGYGYEFSGTPGAWFHVVLNLKQWNRIGDLTTTSCPALVVQFQSNATTQSGFGARIDDLTIGNAAPGFLTASITATPSSGTVPLNVNFTPVVAGATSAATYEWLFGDAAGTIATTPAASFTYTTPGDYWARLRVNDAGVRSYAHTLIHAASASSCSVTCTANAPATAATGSSALFQATATGCSGTPSYSWTFGDGQSSTQQNASHAYAAAGNYSWTMSATISGVSCSKSGSITIGSSSTTTKRRAVAPGPGETSSRVTVVNPRAVTLTPGGRQTFVATVTGTTNGTVTWSVQEGASGGSITSQGSYTAPSIPGIYRVVATSVADTSKSGSACVMVSTTAPDPAYAPKPTASGTTAIETRSVTTTPNVKSTVTLGDGTKVEIPPLPGALTVTVTRETNSLDAVRAAGQETSGAMRTVTITGASLDFVPTITIPAAEAGSLSALNVARVGPVVQGGQLQNDKVMFLPAARDASGNIVVRDIYLRGAARVAPTSVAPTSAGSAAVLGIVKTIRSIWTASTYQGKINWAVEPQLVRMIPSPTDPAKRRPLSTLPKAQQDEILRRPVQNAIVLVHGHNEAERYGEKELAEINAPWLMKYKLDVWTALYQEFQTNDAKYADCTAFYEYIYPSYRPIFDGSGELLGTSLARMIGEDPQLKKLSSKYNLFFVAHSMGGLVARSAINQLSSTVSPNFEKLVTWGTPHHGSPVVTMRYLLTSGYNLEVPNMCVTGNWLPLETLNQFSLWHGFVKEEGAVDTPGERELRWDNSKPLNLEGIGWKRAVWQEGDDARWDPARNPDLYNSKLAEFNRTDKYPLSDKYVALYGITDKMAPIDLTSCSALKTFATSAAITQGNGIIHWLYNNPATIGSSYATNAAVKESDGAVSVDSMVGLGVFPALSTRMLENTDHEQYYGEKGDLTASWTFERLKLKTDPAKKCDCPTLVTDKVESSGSTSNVSASLTWPGEMKPGQRVKGIASARGEGASRVVTPAKSFTAADDGKLTAVFDTSTLTPAFSSEKIVLLAQIKDGSELSASVTPAPLSAEADIRFLTRGTFRDGKGEESPGGIIIGEFEDPTGLPCMGGFTGLTFSCSWSEPTSFGTTAGGITLVFNSKYDTVLTFEYHRSDSDGMTESLAGGNIPRVSDQGWYFKVSGSGACSHITKATHSETAPDGRTLVSYECTTDSYLEISVFPY